MTRNGSKLKLMLFCVCWLCKLATNIAFICVFFLDLLRSLLLQCPLCQWTEHLSQSAAADTGVSGHERQQWLVAGGGRRPARLCAFQLHPQIRIHMNKSSYVDDTWDCTSTWRRLTLRADRTKRQTSIWTHCDFFFFLDLLSWSLKVRTDYCCWLSS